MKNRLFLFLTPCMIASVGLFVMIVDSLLFFRHSPDGYNHTGILAAYFGSYLLIDYFLRRSLKTSLIVIWAIEIALIILSAIIFWNSFPFKHFTVNH